jgi:hypothetical protein
LASVPSRSQILGTTARQLPKGSLKLLTYYQGTQGQNLNFQVSAPAQCSTGNGLAYACGQSGDVAVKGSGGMGVVKLVYQPWESFQYYAAFGVGEYSISVPSVTATNKLTGDNPGYMGTIGLRSVVLADTQFTPAVAIDGSVSWSRYSFNRIFPEGGASGFSGPINQRLFMAQYQVAVEASHLFTITDAPKIDKEHADMLPMVPQGFKVEPYGGVKWTLIQSDLHDYTNGTHAGGAQNTATPFLGLRIPIYENEGLFCESTFVDGFQYAGGLEIRFK